MIVSGPSYTLEESDILRDMTIMELAAARPDLEPAPHDPDEWRSGIIVTVDRREQVFGVPQTAHGISIYVFVRSLNSIVTPDQRIAEENAWTADRLAEIRG